jgi:predicted MFS family arabinose efflux permease
VTVLHRYAAVLRGGGLGAALSASIVGRLSLGMTGLATLLLVRESTGSYAVAGAVSAAYAVAFALGAPVRARAADRRGPVRVLVQCSVAQPVALIALVILAGRHVPAFLLAVPAVAGGLTVPPLGAVMRALWAQHVEPAALSTAYSLESVAVELCFVVGPTLTAGLAATAGPGTAVVTGGLLTVAGGLWLAGCRTVRAVRPEVGTTHGMAGPLSSPAVRALLVTVLGIGASFGALEVALPAFAERHGSRPAAAGILLAVWSVGSILGGLAYGAVHSQRPPAQQLPWLVTALAVGTLLPLLATGPVAMGVALVLYGSTIAPFMACNAVLLGGAAPRGTATEAFAWSSSMIFGGGALGTATAGLLVQHAGTTAALALVTAAGALTLVVSLTGLRHLQARPVEL